MMEHKETFLGILTFIILGFPEQYSNWSTLIGYTHQLAPQKSYLTLSEEVRYGLQKSNLILLGCLTQFILIVL